MFGLKPETKKEEAARLSYFTRHCQHPRVMRHNDSLVECMECRKVFASPLATHCVCHA